VRDFRDRLQDILDAIGQIEVEQVKGRAAFDGSSLIQVWMVHHLADFERLGMKRMSNANPKRAQDSKRWFGCSPWRSWREFQQFSLWDKSGRRVRAPGLQEGGFVRV